MANLRLESLSKYLETKLGELAGALNVDLEARVSDVVANSAFSLYPPGIDAVDFNPETTDLPAAPSRARPLAWGDFKPEPYLRRDLSAADMEYERYSWIPLAIDQCFSRFLYGSTSTLRTALNDAVERIEEYVAKGRGSWIGLEVDLGISYPGMKEFGPFTERSWDITDTLGFVAHPEGSMSFLVLRRFSRDDPAEQAEAELERFVELLRLYTNSAVATPNWTVYYGWETFRERIEDVPTDDRSGTWIAGAVMSEDQLTSLGDLWQTWAGRDRILDAAVEHFEDSIFSMSPEDTVARAIMSLEAVMASRTDMYKSDVMLRRAPKLIARADRRTIGRLYSIRNAKAHTDSMAQRSQLLADIALRERRSPGELAFEVVTLASDAIFAMHRRLTRGEQLKDIWADLDGHSGMR